MCTCVYIWMDQIHLLGMPRLALRSPATQAFVEAYRTQALTHTQFKSMQMNSKLPSPYCLLQPISTSVSHLLR